MRRLFRDSEHLLRMAGLFVFGTLVFLVVRAAMIPADFGVYGHFRAGAIHDNTTRVPVYAGQDACTPCHGDAFEARDSGGHARIHCEACHGARAAHAEDPTSETVAIESVAKLCLNCHAQEPARPRWMPQIIAVDHAGDESCDACHDPHTSGFGDE